MLSVVVPTRNKADRLRLTLAGLRGQRPPDRFEVVVVADGCTDRTPAVVEEQARLGLPVRTACGPATGRAAARNAGARAAAGELVVFLDDDILLPPGFLAAHQAAHDVEQHVAQLSGPPGEPVRPVGPAVPGNPRVVHGPLRELPGAARLVAADPDDPYRSALSGAYGRTVTNGLERLILAMAAGSAPAAAPWLACVGANVSMPGELWRRAGGFDEAFGTGWGCEDLEFGYRLHAAGAAMFLAPAAAAVHLSHARPGRWGEHEVNLARFAARHPDRTVTALSELLAAGGSPDRYLRAVAAAQRPDPKEGA
jgi:glycosyltransferase involved in cell wall biosynthesis